MSGTYRESTVRCPGCTSTMNVEDAGGAEIDRCGECGGIWFDWFDGELGDVARRASKTDVSAPLPRAPSKESTAPLCPRCGRGLEEDRYHEGPTILRCGECAGAFVDHASLRVLAAVARENATEPAESASALDRFFAALRHLFQD